MRLINDTSPTLVEVDGTELGQLLACIRETLEALEDWEFHTRVGWSREEIETLESNIFDLRDSLPPERA